MIRYKFIEVIFDDLIPELELRLDDDGWEMSVFDTDRNGNDIIVFRKESAPF